jgi:hypothetical protein
MEFAFRRDKQADKIAKPRQGHTEADEACAHSCNKKQAEERCSSAFRKTFEKEGARPGSSGLAGCGLKRNQSGCIPKP